MENSTGIIGFEPMPLQCTWLENTLKELLFFIGLPVA